MKKQPYFHALSFCENCVDYYHQSKKSRHVFLIPFLVFLSMMNMGCADLHVESSGSAIIKTTVDRSIVPDAVPAGSTVRIDDPANFKIKGYGEWSYGPGIPYEKRLDLMANGYDNGPVTKKKTLMRFFTMTDIHITDKESPAQAIYFRKSPYIKDNAVSVYSPLMLYTTHVLDAAVQTINGLNTPNNKIDFGLSLGDMANNSQYNELRWFIDIMDGGTINPDSGKKDDPIPGPSNDYQDEFVAKGLNSSIPWYATMGNHDHFWIGSKPLNEKIDSAMIGDKILQVGNIFSGSTEMKKNTYSTGTLDGSTLYGTIIGEGRTDSLGTIPPVSPDPNRRAITKTDFINEFSHTTSLPKGHGFIEPESKNVFGSCYSFEPKSDLPVKVIVLDDTMDESDFPYKEGFCGHGSLSNGRYGWLMGQLKAGQDESKLMIIAAHIPIGIAGASSPFSWIPVPGSFESEASLLSQLKTYPNLILWVAGHRHLNTVTAMPSETPGHPENGFWEVETKSLREFPQEFRTFELALNSDNTLSIFATDVDPDVKVGSFADISRHYALASNLIYGIMNPPAGTGPSVYNAELVIQLSPEMQTKIASSKIPQ